MRTEHQVRALDGTGQHDREGSLNPQVLGSSPRGVRAEGPSRAGSGLLLDQVFRVEVGTPCRISGGIDYPGFVYPPSLVHLRCTRLVVD
jgi:hypothetical protein